MTRFILSLFGDVIGALCLFFIAVGMLTLGPLIADEPTAIERME
jgi:hypothetical protein